MRSTAAVLALLVVSPLAGQQITVGAMPTNPVTSALVFTTARSATSI